MVIMYITLKFFFPSRAPIYRFCCSLIYIMCNLKQANPGFGAIVTWHKDHICCATRTNTKQSYLPSEIAAKKKWMDGCTSLLFMI